MKAYRFSIIVVAAFLRNAHLKRALHRVEENPALNFWRLTYGNCLDMAVLQWCMLFGSDHQDHQPTHWKNVIPKDEQDGFREEMLAAIGLSTDEWQAYWKGIKDYRDNQAAHFNERYLQLENNPRFPDMSTALEAAYFYYERLLAMMKDQGIAHEHPKDIRDYCQRFTEQAQRAATAAIAATADMKEEVR